MAYKVVSMYTVDTPYEDEVKNLIRSLDKFAIPYTIFPIDNQGSWEKNCQQKAIVIKKALDSQPDDVVWIDADAVVMKPLSFFDNVAGDMSVYRTFRTDKGGRHDLLSGTIYFKNIPIIHKLIEDWIDLNSTNDFFDQLNLRDTVVLYGNEITVTPLPKDYIKIIPSIDDATIAHYQASRRFKKSVDK